MLEPIEQLAIKLNIPVRSIGGLRLISLGNCGKIVEACKSGEFLILGVEAFKLEGGNTVPETDFIADFSELASKQWDAACVEAASAAEAYFAEVKDRPDWWFDFSLGQRR